VRLLTEIEVLLPRNPVFLLLRACSSALNLTISKASEFEGALSREREEHRRTLLELQSRMVEERLLTQELLQRIAALEEKVGGA